MIKNKQHIAFHGLKKTVEWYYNNNGKSHALEYYKNLSREQQKKLDRLFMLMANMGEILDSKHFNFEGDKIYAFKLQPDRFFCFFFAGGKVIVTNAYEKKRDKLIPKEHAKATLAHEDYVTRVKQGTYYDKKN